MVRSELKLSYVRVCVFCSELRGLDSSGLKDALAARLEAAAANDDSDDKSAGVASSSAAASSASSDAAAAAAEDPPAKRRRVRVGAAEVARAAAAAAAAAAGAVEEDNEAMDEPAPAAAAAAAAAAVPAAASAAAPPSGPRFDPKEKRGAAYCASLTAPIRVRITRALSQRLFLINQKEITPLHRDFTVLGATGNVYVVSIKHKPSCICPDAAKGHLCKHILFVMHRVLKVGRRGPDAGRYANSYSPMLYQKAYLSSELYEIFANAPMPGAGAAAAEAGVAVDAAVKKAYLRATGERDEEEEAREAAAAEAARVAKGVADAAAAAAAGPLVEKSLTGQLRHAVSADDDCAICYETLDDHTSLVWCRAQCGQNLHAACFAQWRGTKLKQGDAVDCPHCRSAWIEPKPAAGAAAAAGGGIAAVAEPVMAGGFLNLSAFSAAHQGQGDVYSGATYNSGGSWGGGWGRRQHYGRWRYR